MTPRKRLLALVLLAGVVAVSSAIAGHSDTGFTVTSTLDGKTALPVRIQWIATPQNAQNVNEVDYFIDGYHAWTEHTAPYYYASDGNWLVTAFLKPGLHTFTVRATTTDNQVATDTVKAQVVAAPRPPAKLAGSWSRTVTPADLKKGPPGLPAGRWTFAITSKGWTFGPDNRLDTQYLPSGNVVIGSTIINRPEQTNICDGQPPERWKVKVSPDDTTMRLDPLDSDPCGIRLAVLQGTWTHSHAPPQIPSG
jgi:hypothetical protein